MYDENIQPSKDPLIEWKTKQRFHTGEAKVRGSFTVSYQHCQMEDCQMEVYLTIIDLRSTEDALDCIFLVFLDT